MRLSEAGEDEVDQVVAAWRRERPDLDFVPMQVWSRITRLDQVLEAKRAASYERHGLHVWEFDVLAALRRAGEPYQLSPGQLLKENHVTSGTMTNRIDRLVERGLVVRVAHPHDRRGVLVRITEDGKNAVDAAVADLLAVEQQLLDCLDPQYQILLSRLLRIVLVSID